MAIKFMDTSDFIDNMVVKTELCCGLQRRQTGAYMDMMMA